MKSSKINRAHTAANGQMKENHFSNVSHNSGVQYQRPGSGYTKTTSTRNNYAKAANNMAGITTNHDLRQHAVTNVQQTSYAQQPNASSGAQRATSSGVSGNLANRSPNVQQHNSNTAQLRISGENIGGSSMNHHLASHMLKQTQSSKHYSATTPAQQQQQQQQAAQASFPASNSSYYTHQLTPAPPTQHNIQVPQSSGGMLGSRIPPRQQDSKNLLHKSKQSARSQAAAGTAASNKLHHAHYFTNNTTAATTTGATSLSKRNSVGKQTYHPPSAIASSKNYATATQKSSNRNSQARQNTQAYQSTKQIYAQSSNAAPNQAYKAQGKSREPTTKGQQSSNCMSGSQLGHQQSSRNAAPVPTNLMIQTSSQLDNAGGSSSALRNYHASQNSHTKSNRDNLTIASRSHVNIATRYAPGPKMPRTPNNGNSQTKANTTSERKQSGRDPSYTHKVSGSRKADFNSTTPISGLNKQRQAVNSRDHTLNQTVALTHGGTYKDRTQSSSKQLGLNMVNGGQTTMRQKNSNTQISTTTSPMKNVRCQHNNKTTKTHSTLQQSDQQQEKTKFEQQAKKMNLAQTLSSFVNHHHNTFDNRMSPKEQDIQKIDSAPQGTLDASPKKPETPLYNQQAVAIENKTQMFKKGALIHSEHSQEKKVAKVDAPMIISEPATTKTEQYHITAANNQHRRSKPILTGQQQQPPPETTQDKVQAAQQTQREKTPVKANREPEKNDPLMDESMCFAHKSSLEDYIIGKQIGQGAYAVVRIGLHKPSNCKVAMKIYKKYKLLEPNRRKSVKREIKLMERMRNQYIARLYEVIDTTKYVILVMEYVGGGSLHGYLKSKGCRRLDEPEAKRIFKQVVEGLRYCHNRCITHRDIKLENLLLDSHKNIKIIDFGFSTCVPNDKKIKIFCGTPSYMAPEIVNKTEYCGPPADIWALGVLLFTCLSGCFPYRGATDSQLYAKITAAQYRVPSDVICTLSAPAVDLLARLFNTNAELRINAKDILNHTWLQGVLLPPPIIVKNPVTAFASQPKTTTSKPTENDQKQQTNKEQRSHSSQPSNRQQQTAKENATPTQQQQKQPLTAPQDQRRRHVTPMNPTEAQDKAQLEQKLNSLNFHPPAPPAQVEEAAEVTDSARSFGKPATILTPNNYQPPPTKTKAQTPNNAGHTPAFSGYFGAAVNEDNYSNEIKKVNSNKQDGQQMYQHHMQTTAHVINNNFNIINHFPTGQQSEQSQTQLQPHVLLLPQQDAQSLDQKTVKVQDAKPPKRQIDWKIVQIIVDKLGYSPEEVQNFVLTDVNSFVGVLYQKLLDDQKLRQRKNQLKNTASQGTLVTSQSNSFKNIQQHDSQQRALLEQTGPSNLEKNNEESVNSFNSPSDGCGGTQQPLSTNNGNSTATLSGKLAIQPSFVPSITTGPLAATSTCSGTGQGGWLTASANNLLNLTQQTSTGVTSDRGLLHTAAQHERRQKMTASNSAGRLHSNPGRFLASGHLQQNNHQNQQMTYVQNFIGPENDQHIDHQSTERLNQTNTTAGGFQHQLHQIGSQLHQNMLTSGQNSTLCLGDTQTSTSAISAALQHQIQHSNIGGGAQTNTAEQLKMHLAQNSSSTSQLFSNTTSNLLTNSQLFNNTLTSQTQQREPQTTLSQQQLQMFPHQQTEFARSCSPISGQGRQAQPRSSLIQQQQQQHGMVPCHLQQQLAQQQLTETQDGPHVSCSAKNFLKIMGPSGLQQPVFMVQGQFPQTTTAKQGS